MMDSEGQKPQDRQAPLLPQLPGEEQRRQEQAAWWDLEKRIGGSWVTWAGIGLLMLALGYFLVYAFDARWLTPVVRVMLGAGGGCVLYTAGQWTLKKGFRRSYGLTLLGAGIAALYTTAGSAYFAFERPLIPPALGMLLMTAITVLAVWHSWDLDSEAIGALGLLGALVAPAIFPAQDLYIVQRFIYVFAAAGGAVVLSILKPWPWIRALSFFGSQVIFLGFYAIVVPQGTWAQPFVIASGLFLLFAVGLALESLWTQQRDSSWNLALSVGNAVAFAAYTAILIPQGHSLLTVTLLLCFALYAFLAFAIRQRVPADQMGWLVHLAAAITFFTVTVPLRFEPIGITIAWTVEALLLWVVGLRFRNRFVQWAGPVLWFMTTAYWFITCWDLQPPMPYRPFLNPGALAWAALATVGFTLAVRVDRLPKEYRLKADFATIFALFSHLIVGGLLTIQIENYFEYYPLSSYNVTWHVNAVSLSVSWGLYALLLVGWGLQQKSAMFRWFGLSATLLVLLKLFVHDLDGLDTIYKMVALTMLGIIFLLIGFLYQRMQKETKTKTDLSN